MKRKMYGWIFLIVVSTIIMVFPTPEGLTALGQRSIALLFIAATLWLGELLPIGASSLLIIVLAPIFGTLEVKQAFSALSSDIIFLYIGGFIVAASM